MEFMFSIAILLFIFSLMLFSFASKNQETTDIENMLEKKRVCTEFSNLVYSVYKNGDGSEANMYTDYVITLQGNSSVYVETLANITETKIAILASEAGETSQNFYEIATQNLNPDWYKNCFSDIAGSGCQQWQYYGMEVSSWNEITQDIHDLMRNIDKYDVIYLEDAHIQWADEYNGKTYREILQDWISAGHSLIFSEHLMCREISGWTPPSTSYRCNPPGYNHDVWGFADVNIHQLGGYYGGDDVIVIRDDPMFSLSIGDTFDFEENSYIENVSANDFTIVAEYTANAYGSSDFEPAIVHWRYGNGHIYYFK